MLERRARIVRQIRAFFDSRDFVEVETPVRIAAPAPEEFIDCPPVVGGGYLRASPELQMKKLLARGMDRIYQIGPCFREGERGDRHNPEFTMIEWYRRNETYEAIAEDLKLLLSELFGRPVETTRLTVRDAYVKYAGWDPWVSWDHDRFDLDMANRIEPALKEMGAVFLTDYPVQAASLAKVSSVAEHEPRATNHDYAERWEFYWNGMELANCFTELCDGEEQARRFRAAKARRKELGESDYPIDEEFLACVPAMESAAGVALGIDRLVMVLTDSPRISSVRVI